MISVMDNSIIENLYSLNRSFKGRVKFYNGFTLLATCDSDTTLKSFKVERNGEEGKYFGFGVVQKLIVELVENDGEFKDLSLGYRVDVELGSNYDNLINPFTRFYITEIARAEDSNVVTVTAYDALYFTTDTIGNFDFSGYHILEDYLDIVASALNLQYSLIQYGDGLNVLGTVYENGANLDGTETIREVLDDLAEATQSIYYTDGIYLYFRKLCYTTTPITIDNETYFTLETKSKHNLSAICSATELGDNIIAGDIEGGDTQYVRDNAFWELRDDIANIVEDALEATANIGELTPFTCDWRGNYLLEIGDRIGLIDKNGDTHFNYLIKDTLTFNGGLSQVTSWEYVEDNNDNHNNPSSIGEAIKKTFAKVDKVNKTIDLVVSQQAEDKASIAQINLDLEGINSNVTSIQNNVESGLDELNGELATLTKTVEAKMTDEEVTLAIKSELENGVAKVETNTGFTFNDQGLTVEKSGSEMKTQITEDGMKVFKNGSKVLTANNEGVDAVNLSASTYLIIGTNSRFENYGNNRTGCFWIGG